MTRALVINLAVSALAYAAIGDLAAHPYLTSLVTWLSLQLPGALLLGAVMSVGRVDAPCIGGR